MKMRVIFVLLALAALCVCGGCRVRITQEEASATVAPARTETPLPPTEKPATPTPTPEPAQSEEPAKNTPPTERAPEMSAQEVVDAEAADRAPEEVTVADDSAFIGGGTATVDAAGEPVAAPDTPAADSLTETAPADMAGESNPSDEGGAIGLIIDANAKFLRNGLGALYECEKGYIYFELADAYTTVSRASDLHTFIWEAGGYNIAEKLQGETPAVTDDWVLRKNPNVVVKCTDVLGTGVSDTAAALTALDDMAARPGWNGISAIMNQTVLLLSTELFETDEGRLLAKLYIAEAMYPQLFSGTSIADILQEMENAGGRTFGDGVYALSLSEGL